MSSGNIIFLNFVCPNCGTISKKICYNQNIRTAPYTYKTKRFHIGWWCTKCEKFFYKNNQKPKKEWMMPSYEIKTESSVILSGKILMEMEELVTNFFRILGLPTPKWIEIKEKLREKEWKKCPHSRKLKKI